MLPAITVTLIKLALIINFENTIQGYKVIRAAKDIASGGRSAVAHLASLEIFLRPGRKILRS